MGGDAVSKAWTRMDAEIIGKAELALHCCSCRSFIMNGRVSLYRFVPPLILIFQAYSYALLVICQGFVDRLSIAISMRGRPVLDVIPKNRVTWMWKK
jgi:hypothetical protein